MLAGTMGKHEGETKEERRRRKREKKAKKERRRSNEQRMFGDEGKTRIKYDDGTAASDVQFQASPTLPNDSAHMSSRHTIEPERRRQEQHKGHSITPKLTSVPKNSSLHQKKVQLLISLLPAALSDICKAINRSMCALLLRYSDGLGGVLLSFHIVGNSASQTKSDIVGRILNETPSIHFDVVADVLVFCPEVGTKLTGVVNESFPSHIGLLIHSLFNAMISANHLRKNGFLFDRQLNQWVRADCPTLGTGITLGIGDFLCFTVEKLHECDGIISLEGSDPALGGYSCA